MMPALCHCAGIMLDPPTIAFPQHYDGTIYLSLVSRLSQPQCRKASLRYQFNWVLLHVRIVAVLLITFFTPFYSLCTKVLVFYNYTPRLVENAYFLWIMLNTGKHRKCVSIGGNVLLVFHAPLYSYAPTQYPWFRYCVDHFEASTSHPRVTHGHLTVVCAVRGGGGGGGNFELVLLRWGIWAGSVKPFSQKTRVLF